MGAEEEVREAWERVTTSANLLVLWSSDKSIAAQFAVDDYGAAAEFTRLHRQKIAWVEEEIELQQFLYSHVKPKQQSTMDRTIAARQEALADLRRGWKGKP